MKRWPIYFLHSWQKIIGHHCTDKKFMINQNIRKILSKSQQNTYTFKVSFFAQYTKTHKSHFQNIAISSKSKLVLAYFFGFLD